MQELCNSQHTISTCDISLSACSIFSADGTEIEFYHWRNLNCGELNPNEVMNAFLWRAAEYRNFSTYRFSWVRDIGPVLNVVRIEEPEEFVRVTPVYASTAPSQYLNQYCVIVICTTGNTFQFASKYGYFLWGTCKKIICKMVNQCVPGWWNFISTVAVLDQPHFIA